MLSTIIAGIYSCSVRDLGLSVLQSEADDIKEITGVMPYMAPELLSDHGSYSQATDVYAFGIIMWEISSSEQCFYDIVGTPNIERALSRNH